MHTISFTNEQSGNGVARVLSTHNASALVQSQLSIQDVQHTLDRLHTSLSSEPPFSPHSAQRLLETQGKHLDIALLTHKDQTLTLATVGSGVIFLKRAGQIFEIVGDGHAAQGPPERGDEYILTTNEFLDLIGGLEGLAYYFLHYTSAEVVEMMKTSENQTVVCGFVAIQYGTKHNDDTSKNEPHTIAPPVAEFETPVTNEEIITPDDPTTPKPKRLVLPSIITTVRKKLSFLAQKKIALALLILIPTIFLIYLASGSIGKVVNTTSTKASYIQSIQSQVDAKLKEVDTEAFVNITGVEITIDAARKILSDVPEKERKRHANEITKLSDQISAKEKEVMRISNAPVTEYFDLHLISKEATASDVDFNDSNFYVLDSAQGKVYIIDSTARSHEVLSSDKYKGATQITATGRYVYVLTAKDGIYLAEEDRSTQVIKPDSEWGTITDMKAYTGNIYILDAKRKDILKYPGVDEKTFGDASPYLVAELQGNLISAERFTIDGSVFSAGEDSIMKFTTGRKVDFKLIVPHREVTISAMYTDPDLEQLYVFDSSHQALYAMTKEGIFDRQWIVKQPVIGVAASEAGAKVFAVTEQYIYEIENK
jgi:uncharacterized protein YhbP (UPF0306 family)